MKRAERLPSLVNTRKADLRSVRLAHDHSEGGINRQN